MAHVDVRDYLVLTAREIRAGHRSVFYRSVRAGQFRPLAPGVYIAQAQWNDLDADARFLALIHAVAAAARSERTFSHLAAAALWQLPVVGSWPKRPEVLVDPSPSGQSRVGTLARIGARTEPRRIEGLLATPLARTLVDVARTRPMSVSVSMLDYALGSRFRNPSEDASEGTSLAELMTELELAAGAHGTSRALAALMFANGMSGSPGETVSRCGMHVLGFPAPILQHSFYDAFGLIGIVDFWWPEYNLIGEFDGLGKYRREELLRGHSTADAVIAEKIREDRLRALGPRVCRWGWSIATSLPRLDQRLRESGLLR